MLTKNTLTPELQIERWEDRRDIKNLMGRYAYDLLIKNEKKVYKCKKLLIFQGFNYII